eukprot:1126022_1
MASNSFKTSTKYGNVYNSCSLAASPSTEEKSESNTKPKQKSNKEHNVDSFVQMNWRCFTYEMVKVEFPALMPALMRAKTEQEAKRAVKSYLFTNTKTASDLKCIMKRVKSYRKHVKEVKPEIGELDCYSDDEGDIEMNSCQSSPPKPVLKRRNAQKRKLFHKDFLKARSTRRHRKNAVANISLKHRRRHK